MRCGDPIWQTRSTWPMSMPSSSDAVATSAFSLPFLAAARRRAASPSTGCRDARSTASSPRRSLRWRASRSASRRVLTKTSVVRCAAIELREPVVDTPPRPRATSPLRAASRGTSSARSSARRWPSSTIAQSRSRRRRVPTRKRATLRSASASPRGRCAASGASATVLEALERQREVRAAARADDRVDLVDDHRPDGAQHLAAALGGEQQVQRLRRRDQDVRRRPQHRGALGLRRVAGADGGRDPRRRRGRAARRAARCRGAARARFLWMSALSAFSGET